MTSSSITISDGLNFVSKIAATVCVASGFGALGAFTVKLLSDKTGLIAASYCLNPVQGAVMWATAFIIMNIVAKKETDYLSSLPLSLSVGFIATSLLTGMAITKVSIAAAAINTLVMLGFLAAVGSIIPD